MSRYKKEKTKTIEMAMEYQNSFAEARVIIGVR